MSSFVSARPCRYYKAGYCWRGSSCGFHHSELTNTSIRHTPHDLPSKPPHLPPILDDEHENPETPIASTSTSKPVDKSNKPSELPEKDPDETCGICLDYPETYYGLLCSCSHVFCLPCIRNWRTQRGKSSDQVSMGILRRCPLCRIESTYLVQSPKFYPNGSKQKDLIVKATREKWAEKPCKNFNRFGNCSFGKECFYKHVNFDGQIVELPHTHQEWLSTRAEPDFPGTSLVQRATGNGLEPMHMLARLLTNQPTVRDYLVRVTGSTVEEVDLLLQRFASGQRLERPIVFGHRGSRVARETETGQREGQDASVQNSVSQEPVIATDAEQSDAIQSGVGRSSDGETRLADTHAREANEHIDPRITSDVELRSGHELIVNNEVPQNVAVREVEITEVASENCDGVVDQLPTPGPSALVGGTHNGERDQISSSSSVESTGEPTTHGVIPTAELNDELVIPQTTSEPTNRVTLTPSIEPSTSSTQPEQTAVQVSTTTQSDSTTSTQPQLGSQPNPTNPPPEAQSTTNPSTDPIPPPIPIPDPTQPTSTTSNEETSISLSQNVAPLARAILGPDLQRVADEVERHIMELVSDFLSLDESVEVSRLATRWLRGIIGLN
ncbi:uncharacterized protein MELLADRAFT_115435 [Melampsora larici-populina 98AG31]|uniref:RING-type E3 ubiquitin transferase n=1 Tax=Melampsora larici-populina (strain 98AG31 / pathotype 3-4-7) TaxID=747676 RepID=F4RAG7_MELLP|nr:uncharacterized protein MELLADRAFT_115435 [Melampsora larici-populina 98AG31]EGG10785.1 hypothetical protein MELLADRAFT_115435 [Melampsora larici-populina 98AG31]